MLYQVAAMVGRAPDAVAFIDERRRAFDAMREVTKNWSHRPKVFFEEWDDPLISGIQWVSELVAVAGGEDCFPELATQSLGKNRIIATPQTVIDRQPDMVIGSWCGKKFRPEKVAVRVGWASVPAVRDAQIFEIKSADILQPGPAALTDGVAQLHARIVAWGAQRGMV